MAFSLDPPRVLKNQGWKVKIRDKERVEPPHVSVLRKTKCWRYGLRERQFLDEQPPPDEVPEELVKNIAMNIEVLISEWDRMYPNNRVNADDNDTPN